MNKPFLFSALALIASLILTGCNTEPEKTDSMIRREKADLASLELVKKAQALITTEVLASPDEHLDELLLAKESLYLAKMVYKDARILNWKNAPLTTLDEQIIGLNNTLAQSSLDALRLALDKTKAFKKQKEEVETLPVYDNTVAKQGLQRTLNEFNEDLNDCCIKNMASINRLLSAEKKTFRELIKLNHNALLYLGKYVREEIQAKEIADMIQSEQNKLDKRVAALSQTN